MHIVRTPCVWIGGKIRLVNWILPCLDVDCATYVEPFGGSAAVLLNRAPSPVEVYNDLDGALVTFMLCFKNHYDELCRQIRDLPYSRELFRSDLAWLKSGCPGRLTDIQFAARWWYLNLLSYGGAMDGFGTAVGSNRARGFMDRQDSLRVTHSRLRQVLIEHEDFRTIIPRYDSDRTLFYCDPPYIGTEQVYRNGAEFGEQDHRDLAALLNSVQGRVAVSYYPHPLLDKLYPKRKWCGVTKDWSKSLHGTPGRERNTAAQRPRSTELLLMNYKPDVKRRFASKSKAVTY
jgi:DNA adenine methylase